MSETAEHHIELGIKLMDKNSIDDAIREYNLAIELNPDSAESYRLLGVAYNTKGLYHESLKELRKALKLDPNNAKSHNAFGFALENLNLFKDALEEYKEAIRLSPYDDLAHESLGALLFDMGDLNGSLKELREASRLNPKCEITHYNLGLIYDRLGFYKDAIKEYNEALSIKPNYSDAQTMKKEIFENRSKNHNYESDYTFENEFKDNKLLRKYIHAKNKVLREGMVDDLEYISNVDFEDISEENFLKELAFVILCSGMGVDVVRKVFPKICDCFYDFTTAKVIVDNRDRCLKNALLVFNNKGKINAIVQGAQIIRGSGFEYIKKDIKKNPLEALQRFPYIGPVTACHLAKNIGVKVAKPDRHLIRIANANGYDNVQKFCQDISELSGDSIPIIDSVFWIFATLSRDYLEELSKV